MMGKGKSPYLYLFSLTSSYISPRFPGVEEISPQVVGHENRENIRVSVHKDVFSYERLVATSVMEAAAFSLSVVDHGLDDSAIASISFMVARSTSPTPVK